MDNTEKRFALRILVTIVVIGSLIVLIGGPGRIGYSVLSRDGNYIYWSGPDRMTLIYSLEKAYVPITAERPLERWRDEIISPIFDRPSEFRLDFPNLTKQEGVWIFEIDNNYPWLWFTVYANPRLNGARERAYQLTSEFYRGQDNWDSNRFEQLISTSYIYLGCAVRNMDDVKSLIELRKTHPILRSDQTDGLPSLHQLRLGVEKQIAQNPADENELSQIRAEIPVLIERANRRAGHPMDKIHVLYLDGSIQEIPFGSRFPATQEFLDVLYPST